MLKPYTNVLLVIKKQTLFELESLLSPFSNYS